MVSLFFYFVYAVDLAVILYSVIAFKGNFPNRVFLFIFLHSVVNSLANTVNEIVPSYYRPISSAFTVIEFVLFSLTASTFINSLRFKKVITYCCWAFSLFVFTTYFLGGQGLVDSVPIAVESILLFLISFKYFFQEMNEVEAGFMYEKYQFWIISGILIYLGGSFFIYLFANHIEKDSLAQFWPLTYVFYIIKGLLFLFAINLYFRFQRKADISSHLEHKYGIS